MIDLYADLVMLGLRALDVKEANEKGVPLVPAIYRSKVKEEVDRRIASGEFKS